MAQGMGGAAKLWTVKERGARQAESKDRKKEGEAMRCTSFTLGGTKYCAPGDCAKVLDLFLKELPEVDYKCLSFSNMARERNTLWIRPSGVSAMLEIEGTEQELYELLPSFKVAAQDGEDSARLYSALADIVRP